MSSFPGKYGCIFLLEREIQGTSNRAREAKAVDSKRQISANEYQKIKKR
jgi:hypothetical protein